MTERERRQAVGRVPWRSRFKYREVTWDQDALRQDGLRYQSTGKITGVCRGVIMWKPPEALIGFRMFGGGAGGGTEGKLEHSPDVQNGTLDGRRARDFLAKTCPMVKYEGESLNNNNN